MISGQLSHVGLVSPDGERQSVPEGAGWGQGVTAGLEKDGGQEENTWGDV